MPARVADEKRLLRLRMSEQRRLVDPECRRIAGEAVTGHVIASGKLPPGRRVAMYAALPDELPTSALLAELLRRGHTVLLPRARGDRRLEFASVEDPSLLVVGAFGALEPPVERPGVALLDDDLVLLPGVAFDRSGRRLGRGGGWYDRSLPPRMHGLFGLAYRFQIVEEVPVTPLDRCVAGVFTEVGFHRCGSHSREAFGDSS